MVRVSRCHMTLFSFIKSPLELIPIFYVHPLSSFLFHISFLLHLFPPCLYLTLSHLFACLYFYFLFNCATQHEQRKDFIVYRLHVQDLHHLRALVKDDNTIKHLENTPNRQNASLLYQNVRNVGYIISPCK